MRSWLHSIASVIPNLANASVRTLCPAMSTTAERPHLGTRARVAELHRPKTRSSSTSMPMATRPPSKFGELPSVARAAIEPTRVTSAMLPVVGFAVSRLPHTRTTAESAT